MNVVAHHGVDAACSTANVASKSAPPSLAHLVGWFVRLFSDRLLIHPGWLFQVVLVPIPQVSHSSVGVAVAHAYVETTFAFSVALWIFLPMIAEVFISK